MHRRWDVDLSHDMPDFEDMKNRYFYGEDDRTCDPDLIAEGWLTRQDAATIRRAAEQIDRILQIGAGRDDEWYAWNLDAETMLPTGGTWAGWLRYLRRLFDSDPDLGVDSPWGTGLAPGRVTAFESDGQRELAVSGVIGAHQPEVDAWLADPGDREVLHLYASLPEPTGGCGLTVPGMPAGRRYDPLYGDVDLCAAWMTDRLDEQMHRFTGSVATGTAAFPERPWDAAGTPLGPPYTFTTHAAVVVLGLNYTTLRPKVYAAYPEVDLQTSWRERYPDLPMLFGGLFYQRDTHRPGGVRWWREEAAWIQRHPQSTRDRVADQLADLVAGTTDEELGEAVEALGSYVLPQPLRRWVVGLHRRLTWIDWSGTWFAMRPAPFVMAAGWSPGQTSSPAATVLSRPREHGVPAVENR